MKMFQRLCLGLVLSSLSFSAPLRVQDLVFELPENWKLRQETQSDGLELLGFENHQNYLQVYVVPSSNKELLPRLDFSRAKVKASEVWNNSKPLVWKVQEVVFQQEITQVASTHWKNFELVLLFKSGSPSRRDAFREILKGISPLSDSRSLTGPDFSGRKFYLGFGDYLSGFMGNEVKYDIAHTHDVFTSDAGGDYEGVKIHGSQVGKEELVEEWQALKKVMTDKDMYVQYSSGHGSKTGLSFGPSYREIRDNALAYPAKEIIIFIMSCYSGNLVEAFNQKKTEWENWAKEGRTLMVMASSRPSETSSTGPGVDPEEAGGPAGSAGSAFGHSLWKALIGHADGETDGIKDGYLTLAEIRDFTRKRTQQLGGHTPITTGSYNENLLMAKVPSQAWVQKTDQETGGMTDAQIIEKINELDVLIGS